MPVCARLSECPLFTVPAMAQALALWRTFYCDGRPDRCERLQRVEAGDEPPINMLPNGKLLELTQDD